MAKLAAENFITRNHLEMVKDDNFYMTKLFDQKTVDYVVRNLVAPSKLPYNLEQKASEYESIMDIFKGF